jgi:hypothetical protein
VRRAGKANKVQGREGGVTKTLGGVTKTLGGVSLTAKSTVWYVLLCAKGKHVL